MGNNNGWISKEDYNATLKKFNDSLNAESKKLKYTMNEKSEDLSQMIADSIYSIAARIDDRKSQAIFYVCELNKYISYILALNSDKLEQDKFSLVTDTYNDAMGNIENEDYEAAISRAWEGISLSVALSIELEILK